MGGICSRPRAPITAESERLDRMLEEEKTKDQLHFKILLLGAGESGTISFLFYFVDEHFLTQNGIISSLRMPQPWRK